MTAWCESYPDSPNGDGGGCECELDGGHEGLHKCVCGVQWDDDGRVVRPDDAPAPART